MTSIIIKKVNKKYADDYAISKLLDYIYRYNTNYHLPIHTYGIVSNDINYIKDAFYEHPEYGYNSDLSPNVIHLIVSFPRKKLITRDRYLVDTIARVFTPYYYTCYSFHNDSKYAHAHIVVSTRNKDFPLTQRMYNVLRGRISQILQSPYYNKYYNIMQKEDYYV